MPHPHLTESELPKRVLALPDCGERLARHWPPILNARGQAGRGRFVPYAQTHLRCQLPDVLFRETGIEQWRRHLVHAGGLLPWPKVSQIIDVDTISDGVETAALAICFHCGEKLIFAVIAAGRIVNEVFRPFHFTGVDDRQRNPLFLSESYRIPHLRAREAG